MENGRGEVRYRDTDTEHFSELFTEHFFNFTFCPEDLALEFGRANFNERHDKSSGGSLLPYCFKVQSSKFKARTEVDSLSAAVVR